MRVNNSCDFDPMHLLADALEDAGCDHPNVLAHCRGPGEPASAGIPFAPRTTCDESVREGLPCSG